MTDPRLRMTEVYTSIQGEGPCVGLSTVFVRFAGCNLRCPGWPCDTPHAIDPKIYRANWQEETPQGLLDRIPSNIPNICLTGGEPFLQNHGLLKEVVLGLIERDQAVECFSNGTVGYPLWAFNKVRFIMDFKLPGSGEMEWMFKGPWIKNFMQLGVFDSVKFVIKDEKDWATFVNVYQQLRPQNDHPTFFVGKVWNSPMTDEELVDGMIDLDPSLQLNVQLHKYIWHPDKQGV